jgi:hypothetical protein
VATDHTSRIIATHKYVFPIKIKDSEGNETWVKILKSDLKLNFQIEDGELDQVETVKDLENLMSVHLDQLLSVKEEKREVSPEEEGFLDRLSHSVIKFFLCHLFVYPTVKSVVRGMIEGKNAEELADIYVKKSQVLLSHVQEGLEKRNKEALEFFGNEMISQTIDEILISEINKRLVKQNEPEWDEIKIIRLNELRVVDFFRKNPDKMTSELLDTIHPYDIALSELRGIPATDANLDILSDMWMKVITDPYMNGNLGSLLPASASPKDIKLQAYHAGQYLGAYHGMPERVRVRLTDFFEQQLPGNQLEQITRFALQHSAVAEGVTLTNENLKKLQNEQKIYSEKIKPLIQKKIEGCTDSADASDLLKLYTQVDERALGIFNLIETIWDKFETEEKALFPKERLRSFIFNEIEKELVSTYYLTSTQLNNLIQYKEEHNKLNDDYEAFSNKMKEAESESEVFELLNFEELIHPGTQNLEDILPSAFPEIEAGYETSPLTDLKRKLAVQRLKIAKEQVKRFEKTLSSGSNEAEVKLYEESLKWLDYKSKLSLEVEIGKKYLGTINNRIKYKKINQHFKRANDHIDRMLYSQEVTHEILHGQNFPLFSPEQQLNLMALEVVLNRSKLNSIIESKGFHNKTVPISKDSGKAMLAFLEEARKDPKFMKTLESFQSKKALPEINKVPAGISKDTLDFVSEYFVRVKKMEKMAKAVDRAQAKAENLLTKYKEDPSSIAPNERLSLKELGILSASERLDAQRYSIKEMKDWSFIKELKNAGILNQDFIKKYEKSHQLLEEFNAIAQQAVNMHYDAGDLFAYNGVKKEKWQGKSSDLEQKMTMFVADNLTHGGKLYRKDNEILTSHLLGGVVNRKFNFYEICVSDVWKLDLTPLFSTPMQETMQKVYGNDWVVEIMKKYQVIENQLQKNSKEKFTNVENDSDRRFLAGLANYGGSLLQLVDENYKGHKRDYERDFNKLHEKFFNDNPYQEAKQICSEFASKVTLVSMVELNKQLTKKLIKRGVRDNWFYLDALGDKGVEVSEEIRKYVEGERHYGENREITLKAEKAWKELLKKNGVLDQAIELAVRIGNHEIMDLPYSRTERLKAIHPGRMVSLLVEKNCATKRELPPELQALLDID